MALFVCTACHRVIAETEPSSTEVYLPSSIAEPAEEIQEYTITEIDAQTAGIHDIPQSQAQKPTEEENSVTEENRTIIAKALGITEDSRNIRFILNGLNAIGVGQIRQAELVQENGEDCIRLISEDATEYVVYLSRSGNIEAVQNLTTGEWPMKSER